MRSQSNSVGVKKILLVDCLKYLVLFILTILIVRMNVRAQNVNNNLHQKSILPCLGAKICTDICRRTFNLFQKANSFVRAKLEGKCDLRGTDNVQGPISVKPNGGYRMQFPSLIG